jgi:predicted transcriptional regulator
MKIFSPIQNDIVALLKNAHRLRYGELKTDKTLDNDLFNYHLQQLVKKGYIEKSDSGYYLSLKGVHYVADANVFFPKDHSFHLFKMNVITIVSRVEKGETQILNQIRRSHPSYGSVGVMGGGS